mgnify:CR=1 FL=1
MEKTDSPAKVASNDRLAPVAEGAYRCIAPACTPLGCCDCNCAVPADVYAALGRAFTDVERERCMGRVDQYGRYWVENRGKIIDAITRAGFELMSDRNHFWLSKKAPC